MDRLKSSLDYIYRKLSKKWTLVGVLGVASALSWGAVFASAESRELKVYIFDVGQGDAIFLELSNRRQILIDGGPDDKVLEKLNSVMPFWDRSIDIMIATHGELDHIGGLRSVLEHYDVAAVIWNGIESETKTFKEWKTAVDSEGAEVLVGEYGMRFTLSDSDFFEILHPPIVRETELASASKSQNNFALVVRFVHGEDTFLFTGDIERQAEYKIIEKNPRIDSDVLKVAHHGSKTSSSELFLEKVNPKIAVISAGRNNTYGHPHEAILQRLTKYGIKIRRTDTEGDILLISNGNSF